MNRLMRQADQLVEVARRTFDTPEFRGITFIEAEAKLSSITSPAMPFSGTINPYRGCSHACRSGVRQSVVADEVRAKRTKSSALCQRRLTPIGGPGDCGQTWILGER